MKDGAYLTLIFGFIGLVLAVLSGWVINVVALFSMSWETFTPELLARIAGIPLVPLGGLLGWFL